MRPMSLALRLGLIVTGVGLLLAVVLVVLVYGVLDRELDKRAADQLQAKAGQILHSLEERPADSSAPWQHALADALLGHEELSVTVLSAAEDTPLYGLGSHAYADELRPGRWPDAQTLAWHSDDGHDLLTVRTSLAIPGLPPLQLLLSQDRSQRQISAGCLPPRGSDKPADSAAADRRRSVVDGLSGPCTLAALPPYRPVDHYPTAHLAGRRHQPACRSG